MNLYKSFMEKILGKAKKILTAPILNVGELVIGKGVKIGPNVIIDCKRLVLGDGATIGAGTRIEMTELIVGDYTNINNNCLFTGDDWCRIGHNCWFGHYSVVNSTGTLKIGNGVGVGAFSQLWTHIYFGDILDGCRFASRSPLVIEDDVWFVGHCIVTSIIAHKRSMAMVGSVITHDMDENKVYAGVPAKDMTDKVGAQFETTTLEKKKERLENYLQVFLEKYKPPKNRIRIVEKIDSAKNEFSQFSLTERLYFKHLYPEEVSFMNYLSPTKAKFFPHPDTDWVQKYLSIV